MPHRIAQHIVEQADRCTRGHACLDPKAHTPCEVKDNVDDVVVFIEPVRNSWCDYRLHFGDGWICNCPVRKELSRLRII